MIGRRCPAPPVGAHGSSWRGGPLSTGLRWMPRGVLDLRALRSRTTLLQFRLPNRSAARAAPSRQPPPPAQPRRTARSSRPSARIPASEGGRDGSGFPIDLFSGKIRLWDIGISSGNGSGPPACGFRAVPASGAACTVPALRRLAGAAVSSILSREDRALEDRTDDQP